MSGFERYESSQTKYQSRQQYEQQQQYYVGDHNYAMNMNMAPAQSYPSLSAGQGQPAPPRMLLGSDESMMMARIEKDLPSVPTHEGDESTFNEYASSQVFYPPPQEFPTDDHHQEYEYQNTNQQSYMPYSGEQAAYHSKPYVEDPLVLQQQYQMQHNTLNQPLQSQPRRMSKLERDDFEPYKRRNFCCCFRRRGHCIMFFVSIFVAILVLVFLALPFQFFSFDASDPFLPSTSTSGLNIASRNPLSLSFTIGENITVASPSYFTWGVRQLTVNMQLKDAKGDLIPGFNGAGFQKDLRFPARSSTNFTLPVLLNYTSTQGFDSFVLTQDPAYIVLNQCRQQSQLQFRLKVILDISSISWTGWYPSVSLDLNRNCPRGIAPLLTALTQNQNSPSA